MSPNIEKLRPIRGVAYTPTPSDDSAPPPQKYFDSDFTNSTFPLLWSTGNNGRGDNAMLQGLGVNFVHLYDWSVPPPPGQQPGPFQRNHLPFLASCARRGIRVFVPISNFFLTSIHNGDSNVPGFIQAIAAEIYQNGVPNAGAGIWGIGNEYDLAGGFNVHDVVKAMVLLVQAEQNLNVPAANRLPVTSPISFAAAGGLPPAILATRNLLDAIRAEPALGQSFIDARYVASVNSFNGGDFLVNYFTNTFPQAFPGMPVFLSEMGINVITTEEAQASFVQDQLAKLATIPAGGPFLGTCIFQFLNESAVKTGSEATFGMLKYSGSTIGTGTIPPGYNPGGGQTYPVDKLLRKPLFLVVQAAFRNH